MNGSPLTEVTLKDLVPSICICLACPVDSKSMYEPLKRHPGAAASCLASARVIVATPEMCSTQHLREIAVSQKRPP